MGQSDILEMFSNNPSIGFTSQEIQQHLKININNVYRNLRALHKYKQITRREIRPGKKYTFKYVYYLKVEKEKHHLEKRQKKWKENPAYQKSI